MTTTETIRDIDHLILGAGPAGLQLAYFMDREQRDYLVLEANDRAGAFYERFPRHGKLISINKVYNGYTERRAQLRYDWNSLLCDDDGFNFQNYTDAYYPNAQLYAQYLRDYAARFDLKIQYNTWISDVSRAEDGSGRFIVRDADGNLYRSRTFTVATGVSKPYVPEIPGIELTENYFDMSIDPKDYADQRLLIIGKGNSAFETANHLLNATRVTHLASPGSIKMAWQSHFFGHLRAVNNEFLDTYILKGQNSVLDANIDKIEKVDGEYRVNITFTHAEGQRAEMAYDRVICCTGFRWDPKFFGENCRPDMACEDRLPAMTSGWESTNIPNLYYAGTIMQIRDLKKTMSNVLHGFRFNIKSLYNIIAQRHESTPYPSHKLTVAAEPIAEKIIDRVSSDAGLMHQPGFLGDCMVVDRETGEARYHEGLAVDYILDSEFGQQQDYYIITMEYGDFEGNVFSLEREPHPEKAYNDAYLHPRIRHMRGNALIAEHHISESLENDWRLNEHCGKRKLIRAIDFVGQEDPTQYQQTHFQKLVCFFERQLAVDTASATPMCHESSSPTACSTACEVSQKA
ncbi:NAD(P)-binding domain-containing protein [Rosistilla oblonga]|uniref:NAD(P)-binding domain-containing protein n=1 Tax=Rosistilla oblonga TaxID=2527990 RepID=UPI003A9849C9